MGFDYGGFGLKAEYLPVKYVGIFGGIGYNLAQMGYNAGLSFKVLPDKKVTPAIAAMYGYNAVIKITGAIEETTTYYGFTFGAGVDIKMGRKGNKLSTYLWVPVRSTDFKNDYDYAREYYNLSVITPVNASVGFNFALN